MFTSNQPRVAVLSEDPGVRLHLLQALSAGGWNARGIECGSGVSRPEAADLLLVHMDPSEPSFANVLRRLRGEGGRGIVALCPGGSAAERMRALDHGADHCLPLEPEPQELYSTLRALWRRVQTQTAGVRECSGAIGVLNAGGWSLDPVARTLRCRDGRSVRLSDREVALMAALMRAGGRMLPKAELLAALYPGDPAPAPHRIEVIISRARRKASLAGCALPVRSVFGQGLLFVPQP